MRTKIFGYLSICNNERNFKFESGVAAALSIPLSRFKRTIGCTSGTARELTKNDIGKKFQVEILDPVKMGVCIFLGFEIDALPRSPLKEKLRKSQDFYKGCLAFKKMGRNACIFLVRKQQCDVTPIPVK